MRMMDVVLKWFISTSRYIYAYRTLMTFDFHDKLTEARFKHRLKERNPT